MKYNEDTINKLYDENLAKAKQLLSSLPVADGREPNIRSLNGWAYVQTIHHCLSGEFSKITPTPTIEEEVTLEGRIRMDILIAGIVALEIKVAGSFGDNDKKYSSYRAKAEEKGLKYLYVTRGETYKPYHLTTMLAFGSKHAFFLDTKGDWARLLRTISTYIARREKNSKDATSTP